MSGRAAILAMLAWLAPASASAEPLRIHLRLCDAGTIDARVLRERIALELATDPLEPGERPTAVRVRVECGFAGASVLVRGAHRDRLQRVDLGDAEGIGRTWALALVVADLVRAAARTAPVEQAPPTGDGSELDAPRRMAGTIIGAGLRGRAYFRRSTLLGGIELALSHDWFRVSAAGLGTEVGVNGFGSIGTGLWLLEVAARPLSTGVGGVLLGGELAVTGGVVHGIGRAADGSAAREAVGLVLGASVALRARWPFDVRAAGELALSAGYDLFGAELLAGPEAIVTVHGLRAELSLTLLFAL